MPNISKIKDDILPLLTVPINSYLVKEELGKFKPTSASGPDGISSRMLIELSEELSESLALLFNLSLATGNIPEIWKLSNVTPIFKKGVKTTPGNYRPVSLTSIICKV